MAEIIRSSVLSSIFSNPFRPGHLLAARSGGGRQDHLADQVLHARDLAPCLSPLQDPGQDPRRRDWHSLQQEQRIVKSREMSPIFADQ